MRSWAWGGGGASRSKQCAGEDLTAKSAGRACAERTINMYPMSVTLDVSKLSGWLNTYTRLNIMYVVVTLDVSKFSGWLYAYAYCQVERDAWAER